MAIESDQGYSDYRGECHCGAIGFRYQTRLQPEQWSVRACQCAFCRAHGALSTSDPDGGIEFFADDGALQRYRFALRTADFLLCRQCGVYVGAVIEVGDKRYGIVNVRALVEPPEEVSGAAPVTYDGEGVSGRVERRSERWTPVAGSI